MLTLSQALGVAPAPGPWFGLDANVASAPWSAGLSLVMIMGVVRLGGWCLALLRLDAGHAVDHRVWPYVAPVFGAGFLMVVCYPLALLGVFSKEVARAAALGLLVLGGWQAVTWLRGCVANRLILQLRIPATQEPKDSRGVIALSTLLLVGLGLLALAPVTDPDSLSYHLGVALAVLNSGAFPVAPEWFESRLAGSGEVLIALGLSIGAEQFGALLQLLGVLAIVGILRHAGTDRCRSDWAVLVFLSCPVLVASMASVKPMLLPIAMTTVALYLTVTCLGRAGASAKMRRFPSAYILINFLVMVAATNKLTFFLSGGLVGLLALALMWNRGWRWTSIGWSVFLFLMILLPAVVWKHIHYGGALWESLLTPFPGQWPGTQAFQEFLLAYRDSSIPFPLLLVIPDRLGTITTVLGVGVAALFFIPGMLSDRGPSKVVAIITVILLMLIIAFAPKASRFYLEPMIWLLVALLSVKSVRWRGLPAGCTLLSRGQALVSLSMILVGVGTLSVGLFSIQARHEVMSHRAYGYQVARWLDQVAPPDARVISTSRALALLPRYSISDDGWAYAGGKQEVIAFYQSIMASHRPDHILVETVEGETPSVPNYAFQIVAGPEDITVATRNPFNSGRRSQFWLLRLVQPEILPGGADAEPKADRGIGRTQ
jgi:hypothetical protein